MVEEKFLLKVMRTLVLNGKRFYLTIVIWRRFEIFNVMYVQILRYMFSYLF